MKLFERFRRNKTWDKYYTKEEFKFEVIKYPELFTGTLTLLYVVKSLTTSALELIVDISLYNSFTVSSSFIISDKANF